MLSIKAIDYTFCQLSDMVWKRSAAYRFLPCAPLVSGRPHQAQRLCCLVSICQTHPITRRLTTTQIESVGLEMPEGHRQKGARIAEEACRHCLALCDAKSLWVVISYILIEKEHGSEAS
jgi:hypothetical protein